MPEKKRVFITVKTYPHPSNRYGELVCTAGIDNDGNFIRLYPLQYRRMTGDDQFAKYQWIEIDVEKSIKDIRPESFQVAQDSVITLDKVLNWKDRRSIVLNTGTLPTMCQLTREINRKNRSLAIVKPLSITNFTCEDDTLDWDDKQKESLRQISLWDNGNRAPLKKVPYKFYYHYTCPDPNCNGHKQSVYDWELHVLYLKMMDKYKNSSVAISKVREKFFDSMCDPKFDIHFFVGTHFQNPVWMIIGTFCPPSLFPPEAKGQKTLWSI